MLKYSKGDFSMSELTAFHNSFDTKYRRPFGAVTCGSRVWLSLFVSGAHSARLRLWVDEHEEIVSGERIPAVHDGVQGELYSFEADMPDHPCLVWYYFLIDTDGGTKFYSAHNGIGGFSEYPPNAYQITVYSADFKTPDWFKRTVVYQIFPDRFRRGSVRGGLSRISAHTNRGRKVYLHDSWDEEVLYRPLPGEKHYSPCDFYGGDFEGIRASLPYLKSLNVGCLYLNPIFESPSNHRYDTADYMHADPVLGSDADADELAEACSKENIRVMLDGVFSHTGADSVYFNRYGSYDSVGAYNSRDSKYAGWYDFINYPDEYRSWWGFKNLPEVREDSPDYMAFIKSVLERWANSGFSSWRLDVADELPDDFIRMLRRKLKSLNPDGVLLGEVWEDASNKHSMGSRRGYVNGDELDSVMNYPFREAVISFLMGHIDAHEFSFRLTAQRENYPEPFYLSTLNLLSSHDTVRILSVLGGAPGRDDLSREDQAVFKLTPDARALAKKRLMLAAAIQFSIPGVPCIYYGDEIGMEGMADPFSRRPMTWDKTDDELLSFYRTLSRARQYVPALNHGMAAFCAVTHDVFAVMRIQSGESAIIIINRSYHSSHITVSEDDFKQGPDGEHMRISGTYRDALSGSEFVARDGTLSAELSGYGMLLLLQKR